jgi:hypothetical protein
MPRPVLALLLVLAALALAACGGGDDDGGSGRQDESVPQVGVRGEEEDAGRDLGFPTFATKNTTRVGGADPIANAAAVAQAVFPTGRRPKAVVLVDSEDWRAGVAASAFLSPPVRAPILLSEGEDLPAASQDALETLRPTGSDEVGKAQVIRVGAVARPEGLKSTDIGGRGGAELAAVVDGVVSGATGRTSDRVLVVGSEFPEFAMPAAGWAAKSGDPVLFVDRDRIPEVTRRALQRHQQPKIFVLGPERVVSGRVETELRRLGTVTRIQGGTDAVANAIAFARYTDGDFGWGVRDPGHGLVFVNASRPLDAAAAAPLSASGTYGPLLLHDGSPRLPRALECYLATIRPGYRKDPVRGVYNHGWVIGDDKALPVAAQSQIDALLEILPEETGKPPPPRC